MRNAIFLAISGGVLLIFISLVIAFGSLFFDSGYYADRISLYLQAYEIEAQYELENWLEFERESNFSSSDFQKYIRGLDAKTYSLIIRSGEEDSLLFYSGKNVFPFLFQYIRSAPISQVIDNSRGLFYVKTSAIAQNRQALTIIPLFRQYPVQNRFISNQFELSENIPDNVEIELSPGIFPIYNVSGDEIAYVKPDFFKANKNSQKVLFAMAVLGLVVFLAGMGRIIILHATGKKILLYTVVCILTAILIWVLLKISGAFTYFDFAEGLHFGQNKGSFWTNSFVELVVQIILLFWVGFIILKLFHAQHFSVNLKQRHANISILAINTGVFLLLYYLVHSSTWYWQIPLDVFRGAEMVSQTLFMYLLMFAIISAMFGVSGALIRTSKNNIASNRPLLIMCGTIAAIVILLFAVGVIPIDVCFTILIALAFTMFLQETIGKGKFSMFWFILLLAINSLLVSVLTQYHSLQAERDEVSRFISHLDAEDEQFTLEPILRFKHTLEKDPFLSELMSGVFLFSSRVRAEERIKSLFTREFELLRNYRLETEFYRYDSVSWSNPDKDLHSLAERLRVEGYVTVGADTWSNLTMGSQEDLVFIAEVSIQNRIIYIKVRLSRVSIPETRVYPLLLQDTDGFRSRIGQDYAIYQLGNKIQHLGIQWPAYFYPSGDELQTGIAELDFFSANLFQLKNDNILLMQHSAMSWYNWFTQFLILFFFFLILTILFIFINKHFRLIPLGDLTGYSLFDSLRNKIYLALVLVTMVAFFIAGLVSILNFNQTSDKFNRNQLHNKLQSILSEVKNYLDDAQSPETINMTNLAGSHDVDINMYSSNGRLINSSQPEIFAIGINSPFMPKSVLNILKTSRADFLFKEEATGSLNYLNAYARISAPSSDHAMYFISLPYYAQQHERTKDLQQYLSMLVNIYVLLVYAAIGLGLFIVRLAISPLKIISDQIREFKLGKRNTKIEWQSNDEIGHLVNQYNNLVDQLEYSAKMLAESERKVAWKEMARQIAHEIKNPLTPMKLNLQYLLKLSERDPTVAVDQIESIVRSVTEQIDNLSTISASFSEFAQLPDIEPESKDVISILEDIIYFYKSEQGGDIQLHSDEEFLIARIDKSYFLRVMNNLLNNAYQSVPKSRVPKIVIRAAQIDDMVIIQVEDNGCGIDLELQEKIFQPHFTTKSSGMGLGLAISKKLIEHSGGNITFSSTPDEGTTFTITLPTTGVE